ncbi:MAG TPA: exodeoxyribonuclease VII large subunit [Candidatus Eisenbacteria bacterium]|nr:exodeoxyribonuclease VII large subunit [Candidatus Eisenbacteria bacterium]
MAVAGTERTVFSVSEITRNIRFLLEQSFSGVWVEGEIGDFKRHSSGHHYFSLKDEGAQISCVMFRREGATLSFEPQEGLSVLAFGRVSVYPVRGQYQLYVERMEPKGVGALELRFRQLKEKLEREGLFDAARKRPLPFLPGTIGVVTSIDGAALRDILNVLGRRCPAARVVIYPVAVQGSAAALEIAGAIRDLNREEAADVLIVGRGGGSPEDLWAFNEEVVARAIFESEIPVVSAVGHEVDFTIADFVADLRAATPSAAAELVVPEAEELRLRVLKLKGAALQALVSKIRLLRQELAPLAESRALKDPLAVFEIRAQRLDELKRNLSTLWTGWKALNRERLASAIGKLEALGPLATLARGFSVTLREPEGTVVADASALKAGELIRTKLKRGSVVSRVVETRI